MSIRNRLLIAWSPRDVYVPPDTLAAQVAAFGWRRFSEAQARKAAATQTRRLREQREAAQADGWTPLLPISR
jgi:hypothetical protein